MSSPKPWRVFISYAHVDDAHRKRLRLHVAGLEGVGTVLVWDDTDIRAGENWTEAINHQLDAADMILLLVSADFLRSENCRKEMSRALKRNKAREGLPIVAPLILHPCDWMKEPFAHLQVLPRLGRPISESKADEDCFEAIALGLRERIARSRRPARSRVLFPTIALGVALLGGHEWMQSSSESNKAITASSRELRTGRAQAAIARVEPSCDRYLSRAACFALEKAYLGAMLEEPAIDLEAFRRRLEELASQEPDDPDLIYFAGSLALMDRNPTTRAASLASGAAMLRRALDAAPDLAEANFALASLDLVAGRYRDALPLLDRAVEEAKSAPHYLNARAYAKAQLGDVAGALADYRVSADDGGLILSRIELAPLLWASMELESARAQLETAASELFTDRAEKGRNALPWNLEGVLVIKDLKSKRCYANLIAKIAAGLLGTLPDLKDVGCGPDLVAMRVAAARTLDRALRTGLRGPAAQRAEAMREQLSPR